MSVSSVAAEFLNYGKIARSLVCMADFYCRHSKADWRPSLLCSLLFNVSIWWKIVPSTHYAGTTLIYGR